MYNQKDIVLIPFPYSDLTSSKQGPALIISNDKINKMRDRICCLVTSKSHKDDVLIGKENFDNGSLPFKSFVRPHRIFTIDERIIKKKLCTVKDSFHKKIIQNLNEYVKIN